MEPWSVHRVKLLCPNVKQSVLSGLSKREQLKADAPKALADYYAAEQALRDRTQELRRLRLARDAEKRDLAS